MPLSPVNSDRRTLPRLIGRGLAVSLRQRGRLGRTSVTVLDFNRFGIAVLVAEPLDKEKQIFLSLKCGDVRLDNVIGVVHNCIAHDNGYRCGIQFRTRSDLQFDKDQVERALLVIEAELDLDREADPGPAEMNSAAH